MSGLIWAEPPAAPAARKGGPKPRSKPVEQSAVVERSERPLCLIDGYVGSVQEGRENNGMTDAMKRKLAILERHPGRWALVYEEGGPRGDRFHVGTNGREYAKYGYETATVNGKTYARKPHPNGLPIEALVQKVQVTTDPLPVIKPNSFGWSRDEINNALATARAWLFPTEGIQAA